MNENEDEGEQEDDRHNDASEPRPPARRLSSNPFIAIARSIRWIGAARDANNRHFRIDPGAAVGQSVAR